MARPLNRRQNTLKISGDIDTDHFSARNHDVTYASFRQIKNTMQHLPLFSRNHTRLLPYLNHRFNFILRNRQLFPFFFTNKTCHYPRDGGNDKNNRSQNPDNKTDRVQHQK